MAFIRSVRVRWDDVDDRFGEDAVGAVAWADVDTVNLTRSFLNAPDRFLEMLVADGDTDERSA